MNIIRPVRATHTYTQRLQAAASVVLPLLCPVREADWIPHWEPSLVVSASGVAEPDCVFVTPGDPFDSTWYVTLHDAQGGFAEMLKLTPTVTACKISIRLRDVPEGCEAEITYALTSLGPAGDSAVASFTESSYRGFMLEWEARLNHYLHHGTVLTTTAG